MSYLLAADIGKRRTGLALADTEAGFIMALDAVTHTTEEELVSLLTQVVKDRNVTEIIVGLPLLPQGERGEQALFVQRIAIKLDTALHIPVTQVDERYTTPKSANVDQDASAACTLLSIVLDQRAEAKKRH